MAYIGQGIFARLSQQTGLTTIVSNKIYPNIAPSNSTVPYVTYHKISEGRIHAMRVDPGLASARIQVSSWSTGKAQVDSMARQTRLALQDYGGTTGGVTIQRIFFDGETEISDLEPETVAPFYHIAQDYIVWYTT